MTDASSELLREALVDLQRVRDREASQRAQVETLLGTLRAVVNAGSDDPFGPMLALLSERLDAPDVLMLSASADSTDTLVVRGATRSGGQEWAWPAVGPMKRFAARWSMGPMRPGCLAFRRSPQSIPDVSAP